MAITESLQPNTPVVVSLKPVPVTKEVSGLPLK
jgi:hypothetical protein